MSETLIKLAQLQPVTMRLQHRPKALKMFPLRSTAKMFAVADVIMACSLVSLRYFITTKIVTFPLFQMITAAFYVLVSSFGLYQIFTESTSSFPLFLISYSISMALNLIAGIILGLQTFDMGLMSDNCGDVEICRPFVKPIAIAGWALTATTFAFIVANSFMLVTYWQLNARVLDEQEYGYAQLEESLSSAHNHHHHHSHHHYPANYGQEHAPFDPDFLPQKIQTPQPKLAGPDFEHHEEPYIIVKASKHSKSTTPDSTTDYKSLAISPLDINGHQRMIT